MKEVKERGFEFKGWKLGQKVNLKDEAGIYEIIGFGINENEYYSVAINKDYFWYNISQSGVSNLIYCENKYDCFQWVSPKMIEKLHKSKIDNLVNFRKFIINATKEDLDNHLEGALKNWLDPVIDDLTFEE